MADSGMTDAQNNALLNYGTSAVIAAAGTTSAAVNLGGMTLVGLLMPSTFVGTTVKFQAAEALAGTYRLVTDGAGSDYSLTVAVNKFVPVDPTKMAGVRYLKLVSGSTETGGATVVLALRRI